MPGFPNDRLLNDVGVGNPCDTRNLGGGGTTCQDCSSTADSTAVPFDPYELKDVVGGTIRDPYPAMHALRRESPVHVGPIDLGEGADIADPSRPAPVTVFGFDEVVQVLRDNETYSSAVYGEVDGHGDGPHHAGDGRARAPRHPHPGGGELPLQNAGALGGGPGRARVVNELIDTFIDEGRTDLVRSVTFNFPVQVIARILGPAARGLPQVPALGDRADERGRQLGPWRRRLGRSARLLRRRHGGAPGPRRGTTSSASWCRPRSKGQHLTDEEIFSFLRLILPAGVETTYRASGSLLYALLQDRTQFDALYKDRSLFPQAFEEVVRWEPPVSVILRRATRDTELAGVKIESGADLALLIGAANRDERKYAEPDRYDMFREQRQHVGFGFGVHVCLGMHLARMESRIAINTLFDRLGPFTLDPAAEPPHIEGMAFRSPLSLPVVFSPGG